MTISCDRRDPHATNYLDGMGALSQDGTALAYGSSAKVGESVVFISVATGHKIRSINIPGAVAVPVLQWLPQTVGRGR